jgi:hypothetical protein
MAGLRAARWLPVRIRELATGQRCPVRNISEYLEPMLRAGAEVSVREVPAISHRTTVIAGLWKAPQLVRMMRAARPTERLPGAPG